MKNTLRKILVAALFTCLLLVLWMANSWVVPAASAAVHPSSKVSAVAGSKVIDVNLTQQRLTAFANGHPVFSTLVLSGRAGLETPTGTYSVIGKESPTTFYSPWPAGSPNYYPPTAISYALEWKPGGYYLHDSWWHTVYGPGTNSLHTDPVYGPQNGSHGCISMPLAAARWLYNWAPIGTPVRIHM